MAKLQEYPNLSCIGPSRRDQYAFNLQIYLFYQQVTQRVVLYCPCTKEAKQLLFSEMPPWQVYLFYENGRMIQLIWFKHLPFLPRYSLIYRTGKLSWGIFPRFQESGQPLL